MTLAEPTHPADCMCDACQWADEQALADVLKHLHSTTHTPWGQAEAVGMIEADQRHQRMDEWREARERAVPFRSHVSRAEQVGEAVPATPVAGKATSVYAADLPVVRLTQAEQDELGHADVMPDADPAPTEQAASAPISRAEAIAAALKAQS